MATFQPRQRRLAIGKRQFHFVAYDATPGNPKRDEEPVPAMWFLMVEGRRCPVMLFDVEQEDEVVEKALLDWARENAMAPAKSRRQPTASAVEAN